MKTWSEPLGLDRWGTRNWYAGWAFDQEKVMSSRGPYRRHTPQFRLQLCYEIRSGAIGRRDAARHHNLSTNLLQFWLMRTKGMGIKPRRRHVRTTDSKHDNPVFPNLYQNVIPAEPNRV